MKSETDYWDGSTRDCKPLRQNRTGTPLWHWGPPILALVALVALVGWSAFYVTPSVAQAAARVHPRPLDGGGEQRGAMIAELVKVNAKLDKLHKLFASGQVKVAVQATEDRDESTHDAIQTKTDKSR